MQKYTDVVTSARSGAAIPNARVTVKTYPGGVAATIYSDDGITTQDNPITTDSNGAFSFYAADGRYSLTVSGTGITERTVTDILLQDPDDADAEQNAADVSFTPSGIGGSETTVAIQLQKSEFFESISALEAWSGPTNKTVAFVRGYYAAGDGGGGLYYYDSSSSATDNGGTIITPTAAPATGRWLRQYDAYQYSVKVFGAKGDGTTNDSTACNAASTAANAAGGGVVFFPESTYLLATAIAAKSKVTYRGEGGAASIIKGNGSLANLLLHSSGTLTDCTVEDLGWDYSGCNTAMTGAIVLNGDAQTRIRVRSNRVFDSAYPGDATVDQRHGVIIGAQNNEIWVTDNDISHGGRIKVGYGGTNVWICRNKLNFVNDNGITMAMTGTIASPQNQVTVNVHIEDNIILNPKLTGIFLGADGGSQTDPNMLLRRVSIARNIIVHDSANISDRTTGINVTAPAGGIQDLSIHDNIVIKTSSSTAGGNDNGIVIGDNNTPVGTCDRVSIRRNKVFATQTTSASGIVYQLATVDCNDLVIEGNELQGYEASIFINSGATFNRPTIVGNVCKGMHCGFRTSANPTVVSGTYSRNRVFTPNIGNLMPSTNAMEWRIEDNDILDSAANALDIQGAGTKDFYIINNDFRGAATGPIAFASSGALSANSVRRGNLGDTALTAVASASTITIPHVEVVSITGTTNIDTITATGRAGQRVSLVFADILTVNDGSNLVLAGNFTTSANDVLTLVCDGSSWFEVGRSAN